MKKVAIITLNGYQNYGNRLQNYALQEVIKELGFEVETILHHKTQSISIDNKLINIVKSLINLRKSGIRNIKKKIKCRVNKNVIDFIKRGRSENFKSFSSKYIIETNYYISIDKIPKNLGQQYDFFVTGSDQIWNPLYHYHNDIEPAIEYLTFAPKEKRLSYAASFGLDIIPEKFIQRVSHGLNGMSSILVREQAGVDIVNGIIGREAYLVLDPTMLLTKEKWLSIAEPNINKPKHKYVLTYFLGEMSSDTLKYLQHVSSKYNLEVVHLENFNYEELYKSNPSHFIDFINSATIFLTDSFHGVVFSILLETPFVVFKRQQNGPSMYSRIETLLHIFQLEHRQINFIENNSLGLLNLDFKDVTEILISEREKSLTRFSDSFK